jgi:hypothetical protein
MTLIPSLPSMYHFDACPYSKVNYLSHFQLQRRNDKLDSESPAIGRHSQGMLSLSVPPH